MKLRIILKNTDRNGDSILVVADKVVFDIDGPSIRWELYPMLQSDANLLGFRASGERGNIRFDMVSSIQAFDPFPSLN